MEATGEQAKEEKKPSIEPTKNGPYMVRDLKNLRNSKGVFIETTPLMALCRCGGSGTKPFCDRTHEKIGFSGEKKEDRVPDKVDDYEGEKVSIHDNRGVCSHIGHCTDNLPKVFKMRVKPWINPDGETPENIGKVIRMCPSGALSYSKDGELHKDYPREPEIFVGRNRSYNVVGYI